MTAVANSADRTGVAAIDAHDDGCDVAVATIAIVPRAINGRLVRATHRIVRGQTGYQYACRRWGLRCVFVERRW